MVTDSVEKTISLMSFWRKRGPDGRPSSLLEWDTSCPQFVEKKQGRTDGSLLTIGSLSVVRSLP